MFVHRSIRSATFITKHLGCPFLWAYTKNKSGPEPTLKDVLFLQQAQKTLDHSVVNNSFPLPAHLGVMQVTGISSTAYPVPKPDEERMAGVKVDGSTVLLIVF